MVFWIVIAALAIAVSGILVGVLLRGRVGDAPPAAYDLQVYRDQLKEVDRDAARGLIGTEEAARVRNEISRRILSADAQLREQGETGGQPRIAGRVLAGVAAVVLVGGSLWLYDRLGAPGYRDLPLQGRIAASDAARQSRMTQAEAEERMPADAPRPDAPEEFLQLMERLRETVRQRPDDLRGLMLLARNEARLGNLSAAHEAQARLIAAKGAEATADDFAAHAELMIGAAGGYVSREAEDALRKALQRDPDHKLARYYLGLYLLQVDRPDGAFRLWDQLLREGPASARWIAPIRERIGEIAMRAGVTDYQPPETPGAPAAEDTPRGPDAADMDAAQDMTPEQRQQMIRGMVRQLSERLANEGGNPAEWARLIGAYGVLGETDRARAIWTEAQEVFADKPEALDRVRQGARRAGLVE
ncbi:c-type cytochrome biogenesis protein CcmI [Roseovarius salinarum]|uniref:c-type cytochrome biogenesis protein CcmI n=1 Tax=Roseovarius salinarum TaxID=1981892 RepID=UPI000C333B2B|nr:c-type cytochrome biogenesis protein CcmI [Roseovarius salinarum]